MTIQISLTIWTVIGFIVLSFILNKFLFKPILNVMDARNEKIRKGVEERKAALEREEKVREAKELALQARRQEAIKAAEKAIIDEQRKTEIMIADQKAKYDAELEKIRKQYENDTKTAEENLSESIEKLALKYVKTQIL
mgnify:CR=1 FL=1